MDQKEPKGILVIQIVAMPADTNPNGDIFGGWLVSKMDMGTASEARRIAGSRVVTVAIDALSFIKSVAIGDTVCCYADLRKVGRTSMQFSVEVWTLKPCNQNRSTKVAEGIFTFVAIDEDGNPQPVNR